jgi:hypothetical protein
MHVTGNWSPLTDAIDVIADEYRRYRLTTDALAATFPCA